MGKSKATITLDRAKVERAMSLTGGRTMSEVIDIALERLISSEQLRGDVAAYAGQPVSDDEFVLAGLPVVLDLGDEDVDYDSLYGQQA